ncbi:hypothetical protein COCC4DRAFT_29243 [Bipolaris maydis ATCC 48331]|uniref:Uncharacterized protein n=2 Tax=Cochliobolus heterostrophus TaxID=5016 RepID=M2V700_COCH5|nr:uncharacterized protein COCC4DRAFT_29243 [Bipolaris maydis ATCC 48331]EMD95508.1 hypothetical protein COCHEDRAFT_1019254 [Bipolaris maydis C5]ENI10372.1 hypothetical protein COCC4DRAFT_29243 [Bipolaris maydis ATCC 48331]
MSMYHVRLFTPLVVRWLDLPVPCSLTPPLPSPDRHERAKAKPKGASGFVTRACTVPHPVTLPLGVTLPTHIRTRARTHARWAKATSKKRSNKNEAKQKKKGCQN